MDLLHLVRMPLWTFLDGIGSDGICCAVLRQVVPHHSQKRGLVLHFGARFSVLGDVLKSYFRNAYIQRSTDGNNAGPILNLPLLYLRLKVHNIHALSLASHGRRFHLLQI